MHLVLKNHTRAFQKVKDRAQEMLRDVFAMELVELPVKEHGRKGDCLICIYCCSIEAHAFIEQVLRQRKSPVVSMLLSRR